MLSAASATVFLIQSCIFFFQWGRSILKISWVEELNLYQCYNSFFSHKSLCVICNLFHIFQTRLSKVDTCYHVGVYNSP